MSRELTNAEAELLEDMMDEAIYVQTPQGITVAIPGMGIELTTLTPSLATQALRAALKIIVPPLVRSGSPNDQWQILPVKKT